MRLARIGFELLVLNAMFWTTPARGQTLTEFVQSDFVIKPQRPQGDGWVDISIVDFRRHLDQARCLCDSPIRFAVQMASASRNKIDALSRPGANARLYVGTNCVTLTGLNTPSCPNGLLASLDGLSVFAKEGTWVVNTTVSRLFHSQELGCAQTRLTTVWLWIDSAGRGFADGSVAGSNAPNLGVELDGTPPPAPDGIVAEGADQSLQLSWRDVSVDSPDLAGYLVFCMREDEQQVFKPGPHDNQYMVCGPSLPLPFGPDPMASAAGDTTALEIDAPQPFRDLDPRFLCSDRLSPAYTKYRLNKLQDGVPYTVGVAAVDLSGNASPIHKAFVQTPIAGIDPLPDPDAGPTDAGAARLGSSGCDCRVSRTKRDELPWIAPLGLALVGWLRRRGRSQADS